MLSYLALILKYSKQQPAFFLTVLIRQVIEIKKPTAYSPNTIFLYLYPKVYCPIHILMRKQVANWGFAWVDFSFPFFPLVSGLEISDEECPSRVSKGTNAR